MVVGPYELSGLSIYSETIFSGEFPKSTDQLVPTFTATYSPPKTVYTPKPSLDPSNPDTPMVYLGVPKVGTDVWAGYFPLPPAVPNGARVADFRARYLFVAPGKRADGKPYVRQFVAYLVRSRYHRAHARHEVLALISFPPPAPFSSLEPGTILLDKETPFSATKLYPAADEVIDRAFYAYGIILHMQNDAKAWKGRHGIGVYSLLIGYE